MTNLISWFSVYDFTQTVKQAGDTIFSCASMCQKSSQYGIILQSYCTSKKGAIFYASQSIYAGQAKKNKLHTFVHIFAKY